MDKILVRFKKEETFCNDGINKITAKVGQEIELHRFLAKSYIEKGSCVELKSVLVAKEVADEDQDQEEDQEETVIPADEEGGEIDFSVIFDEDPKLLTKEQLVEYAKEYDLKLKMSMKEATMIKKINEAREA